MSGGLYLVAAGCVWWFCFERRPLYFVGLVLLLFCVVSDFVVLVSGLFVGFLFTFLAVVGLLVWICGFVLVLGVYVCFISLSGVYCVWSFRFAGDDLWFGVWCWCVCLPVGGDFEMRFSSLSSVFWVCVIAAL